MTEFVHYCHGVNGRVMKEAVSNQPSVFFWPTQKEMGVGWGAFIFSKKVGFSLRSASSMANLKKSEALSLRGRVWLLKVGVLLSRGNDIGQILSINNSYVVSLYI